MPLSNNSSALSQPVKFALVFLTLFLCFYYFNKYYFGIITPGNHYSSAFLAEHFDYISALRHLLLKCSAQILGWFGYTAITSDIELMVVGRGIIQVVYTCLGLGVISFFAAFVLAYPKKWVPKLVFLITGIVVIEFLNIVRFVLLALFWNKTKSAYIPDHHTIFNIIIYIIIAISLYFWVKHDDNVPAHSNAKN